MNVFAKPSAEPNAVRAMPWRENDCWKQTNHFVKPSAIEFTRIAETRNGAWKWTFSLSQMSRAALARAMPRRENDCWKQTNHFVKPSAIEFTRIAEARNGAWKRRNHRGFPWGRRRPRLFVGAGPYTSPECRPDRARDFGNDGLFCLKGLYFFSVRYCSIDCISCDWMFISAIFKSDISKRLFIL